MTEDVIQPVLHFAIVKAERKLTSDLGVGVQGCCGCRWCPSCSTSCCWWLVSASCVWSSSTPATSSTASSSTPSPPSSPCSQVRKHKAQSVHLCNCGWSTWMGLRFLVYIHANVKMTQIIQSMSWFFSGLDSVAHRLMWWVFAQLRPPTDLPLPRLLEQSASGLYDLFLFYTYTVYQCCDSK